MQIIHSRSTVNLLKTAAVLLPTGILLLACRPVAGELASILFGGCVFAFLLTPLSRIFEKKLPRPAAAAVSIIAVGMLLSAAVALLLPLLIRQLSDLSHLLPEAIQRLEKLAGGITAWLQHILPDLALPKFNLAGASSGLGEIARKTADTVGSFAGKVYRLFLMAVLGCFFTIDREFILLRAELIIPRRFRKLAVRAGNMLIREMRLYLRGQATIALAVGLLSAIALIMIGVPGAPLLGLLVGLFNVIPYLGPFIGGIPAVITALSISWQKAGFTLLALFLVQQIDGMVVSPRVMGNITGFSPGIVLLAIFVGARIGSVGGMLFALPALMTVRTLYRVFVQRHENN